MQPLSGNGPASLKAFARRQPGCVALFLWRPFSSTASLLHGLSSPRPLFSTTSLLHCRRRINAVMTRLGSVATVSRSSTRQMVDIPSQSAQTQAHSVVIQFDLSGVSAVFIAGQSSGGGSNGHGAFLRIFMSLVTAGHEHESVPDSVPTVVLLLAQS